MDKKGLTFALHTPPHARVAELVARWSQKPMSASSCRFDPGPGYLKQSERESESEHAHSVFSILTLKLTLFISFY